VTVQRCSASSTEVTLAAGDYGTQQLGNSITLTADTGNKDVGELTACGTNVDVIMTITVDGRTYTITSPPVSSDEFYYDQMIYSFWANDNNTRISFLVQFLNGTGTYNTDEFRLYGTTRAFKQVMEQDVQAAVSRYDDIGGYVIGTLTGMVTDTVSKAAYPLSGAFKMKRTN
jgi:hypothetical protein